MFDVPWESEHGTEEDCGDGHGVGRREARLAGAVWAGADDPDFVENEVGDGDKKHWWDESEEGFIDFFEGFSRNKLVKAETGKNCKHGEASK